MGAGCAVCLVVGAVALVIRVVDCAMAMILLEIRKSYEQDFRNIFCLLFLLGRFLAIVANKQVLNKCSDRDRKL